MSVEQRGEGTWRVGVYRLNPETGKRQWIRRTLHYPATMPLDKQRKAAEREELLLGIQVDRGELDHTPPRPKEVTLADFAERWMSEHVEPNLSPVTAQGYRFMLDSRILPALGDTPLRKLHAEQITRWLADVRHSPRGSTRLPDDQLSRRRSPRDQDALISEDRRTAPLSDRTVQHYYDTLAGMLDVAVRWDLLDHNPCEKVIRPKARKNAPRYLDEDRAVELLRCLKDEENINLRVAVLLALLCGLRLGEVGALKFSDINWKQETIDITRARKQVSGLGSFTGPTKTEQSVRVISLPHGMMTILKSHKEYSEYWANLAPAVWVNEDWIVHAWNGAAVSKDTPSKWFRTFADAHGFQGVTFHSLRHTHASQLIASNVDVQAIATRLGHSSADTTLRIYAHMFHKDDSASAAAAQRLLDAADAPE